MLGNSGTSGRQPQRYGPRRSNFYAGRHYNQRGGLPADWRPCPRLSGRPVLDGTSLVPTSIDQASPYARGADQYRCRDDGERQVGRHDLFMNLFVESLSSLATIRVATALADAPAIAQQDERAASARRRIGRRANGTRRCGHVSTWGAYSLLSIPNVHAIAS